MDCLSLWEKYANQIDKIWFFMWQKICHCVRINIMSKKSIKIPSKE